MFPRVLGAMLLLTSVGCAEPEELTANNFFRRERPTVTSGTGGSTGAPTSSTAAGAGTSSSTAASSTAESSTAASSTAASSTAGTGGAGAGGAGNGGAGGRTSAAGGAAGAGTQTAGPGGASGSGGATAGAGGSGSGGAVADAAVDRITPPTMGISLLYKAAAPGAMADSIQAEITINNAGPDTIPLSELTVRYFFTDEIANRMPVVTINYGHREGPSMYLELVDKITKRIAPAPNPVTTADTMVELGFPAGVGSFAKNDKVVLLMKYNGTMFPMVTQTNDYSFDGTKTAPTLWDKIVILRNGDVIWGTPP